MRRLGLLALLCSVGCQNAGPKSDVPLYFDVGVVQRKVTTSSPEAQQWFDRGLGLAYGFNHEEAVTCFRNAAALDPECAMAHWGIAFASGPFYNMPWEMFSAHEAEEAVATCHAAARKARASAHKATPVEQALIGAVSVKYRHPK